jgi:hypothetical protein
VQYVEAFLVFRHGSGKGYDLDIRPARLDLDEGAFIHLQSHR